MASSLKQLRHHSGHSHGHGHSHKHDNTYLTSANRKDPGVRITRIGLYVNFLMAMSKAAGGYLLNSQALLADAFHSLTDLVSDLLTLGTVAWSLKPPTERFPTGYGKIESLGSLGVSSLLLAGGIGLGWHSIEILYNMWFADAAFLGGVHEHVHSHGHGHGGGAAGIFGHSHSHNPVDMGIPNIHAAWIAAASICVKEYLYRATMKIAKERKSSVLASNAVHHRIDSLTSIVALAAILGSNVLSNVSWLDPVGGLLVSIMVVKAGWTNTGSALLELADVGLDSETKTSVDRASTRALQSLDRSVLSSIDQTADIKVCGVQGVKAGQSYLLDVAIAVPAMTTVEDTEVIASRIRDGIGAKVRGARRVRVKFVKQDSGSEGLGDEFVAADISPRSSPEPEGHDEHGQEHDHGHAHGRTGNGDVKKRN